MGYSAGERKDARLVYEAMARIPYNIQQINIFHTDRGSEFKNKLIDNIIELAKGQRSLSKKGSPLDNAVVESTNHILKTEFIYQHNLQTLQQLQVLLFDYVHWYNHERIHGTLGYLSPIEYRRLHEHPTVISATYDSIAVY